MKLTGSVTLPAKPEKVWEWINDPAVLKECIPGCEQIERTEDGKFNAVVKLKIGPISARFKGKVELTDLNFPKSCKLVGEGEGGIAGFAKGGAAITLSELPDGCELSYDAEAQVGGKIAQLGARLLDGVAKKLADQFFNNLAKYAQPESGVAAE